jgi:type VI secretion system secreted protein VgrG
MDGDFWASAERLLGQDQDLAFAFRAATGSFVVESFEADEAVNDLYVLRLNLFSDDPGIDLHALMDTEATLALCSKYSPTRYLTGIIMECARGDQGTRRTAYQITLRPAMARLAHVSDGRIWQEVSVVEVASQILSEHHIPTVDWQLSEKYPQREYLTQVPGERTLDFLRRILNEVGIFWYFEHQPNHCRLIFTDAPLATPYLTHAASITYNNRPGGQSRGSWIVRFRQHERLRSGAFDLGEYWFKNPSADFNQQAGAQENNGTADAYARYEFPGRYKDPEGVGKLFARTRIEAERVDATTGEGEANNIHLCPGWHMAITDHPDASVNGPHFLLSVSHSGSQATALEEDAPENAVTTYTAHFTTMPARLPYRPPTPAKPVMEGPQVGIVVGPVGEEIYCDEHGRVRVWLTWDRHASRRRGDGARHEHSSCWMRVAQNWAGAGWGHIAIPRIGQEVLVSYIDADCDQPIITSRTYNAQNPLPYKLPEHKTRMSIKSKTHKGTGFNELRFEDEAGREEIFVHAQKDRNEKIRNNHTERIDNNFVQSVGRNYVSQVDRNRDDFVNGSYQLTVGSSGSARPVNLIDMQKLDGIGHLGNRRNSGERSHLPDGDFGLTVNKNRAENIGGADFTTVSKTKDINVGGRFSIKSDADITIDAGEGLSIDSEKSLSINSAQTIQISSGAASIVLHKDGTVMIKGICIFMDADELIDIEANRKISVKSGKLSIE